MLRLVNLSGQVRMLLGQILASRTGEDTLRVLYSVLCVCALCFVCCWCAMCVGVGVGVGLHSSSRV